MSCTASTVTSYCSGDCKLYSSSFLEGFRMINYFLRFSLGLDTLVQLFMIASYYHCR